MSSPILPHNPTQSTWLDPIHLAHRLANDAHATATINNLGPEAAADAYRDALTTTYNLYNRALEILGLSEVTIPNNTGVSRAGRYTYFVYEHEVVAPPNQVSRIWSCTCHWHANGGEPRLCKHILSVWLFLQLEREEP